VSSSPCPFELTSELNHSSLQFPFPSIPHPTDRRTKRRSSSRPSLESTISIFNAPRPTASTQGRSQLPESLMFGRVAEFHFFHNQSIFQRISACDKIKHTKWCKKEEGEDNWSSCGCCYLC
jgi:hypothetical protein